MIAAKRTTYKEQTYRSRLEGKWAFFFNRLGIPFEYEPQLIDLGVLRYLPDFKVANSYWLEIKGDMGSNGLTIVKKCELLAAFTSMPVILAFYDPFAAKCAAFTPQGFMTQAHFGMCGTCGALTVKADGLLLCTHPLPPLTLESERHARKLIFDAMVDARDCDQWSQSSVQ